MKYFIITLSFFICSQLISNPKLEELIYKVRDPRTEKNEFRKSLKKIGEYLALEISKNLKTNRKKIFTVMQKAAFHDVVCQDDIVIVSILRAGLPFFDGVLKVFPDVNCGFLAMARDEKTLAPTNFYTALPKIKGKIVIIADVMIATGGSTIKAIEIIEKYKPKQVIVAGVITAQKGKENILAYNSNIKFYTAALDPTLNEIGYIVPGLGDAGDRAYGNKME